VDVPARQISLRPFCPWPEFTWESCRLGHSLFDFSYERRDGRITGQITNRNDAAFDGVIELTLPDGAAAAECRTNGSATEDVERTQRYRRPAVRMTGTIMPGEALQLEVDWKRGPG
jgi:hypothetical protein